jgi:LacI family transcriptional regulator
VSDATSRHVHEVAEGIGYRRDPPHRLPDEARTRVIALAVSDIANPFYAGVIRGAERVAAENDFTLMVADARESVSEEQRMLARHIPLVDGLIVTSSRLSDAELRRLARQRPVAVLNREVPGLPCVCPDNVGGVARAVEHLAGLGHRRIGYLAGPSTSWADGVRWRAVRDTARGIGARGVRIGRFPPTLMGGRAATSAVRDSGVTAVVAYNDLIAVGLLRGLADAGVDVPGDLSVVGFDNTLPADLVRPGLTTVAQPATTLGEAVARHVIALVQGEGPREPLAVLPVELVVRESTGPADRSGDVT